MDNNFEYKIHISIDQKGLKDDVKTELSKVAKELKNNAFKIELTGDPKNLIKQLVDLKKMVPDLDLTKGIHFALSDYLKEDSEQGKKIIDELTTYIINSVSDAVTSIDSINDTIKKTEENLEKLKSRKKELLSDDGAADAVSAFEKAEKRFNDASTKFQKAKQNKGKFAAAEEMKNAYQDMLNYQAEANKKISANVMAMVNDTDKSFHNADGKLVNLQEHLQGMEVNSSYKKDLQETEQLILSNENKLRDLKKELHEAQNPEVRVKGKLADNFIGDLQSQLDALTGLEVKVKPKIDKDVRLEVEVEGDVKPVVQDNKKIESLKPAEKIDLGKYDLSKIEVVNEKLSEYKSEAESISESAQKAVDELNKFTGKSYTLDRNMHDIPSTLRAWNKASMSANDFKKEIKAAIEANEKEKAAILYENLKTYYPKTSATLDTFKNKDFKDNYDSYLSRGNIKAQELQFNPDLQRYRVLEDAIHELEIKQGGLVRETAKANAELEKQAKISSELSKYNISTKDSRNSAIQSLDQQIAQKEAEMAKMLETDKNFQHDYHKLANAHIDHESTEEYGQILKKYNIPEGSGMLQSMKYLANQRGELQETIDILKGVRQAISETNEVVSITPNTSGMDKVEEELRAEASAANEAAEAERNVGNAREEVNYTSNENNLSSGATTPSAIDEITQAEDRMGNEAQEATDQARQGLVEIGEEAKNLVNRYNELISKHNELEPKTWIKYDVAKDESGIPIRPTDHNVEYPKDYDKNKSELDKINREISDINNESIEKYGVSISELAKQHRDATTAAYEHSKAEEAVSQASNKTPVSTESTEQKVSQLEREFEAREKNVQATNEQAEAERVLSSSIQTEPFRQQESQAQATVTAVTQVTESLDKVNQQTSTTTPNSMLDSVEDDAKEARNEIEGVISELEHLEQEKDIVNGSVDIKRNARYTTDKEGKEKTVTSYSVKGKDFSGVLDESGNVKSTSTTISKGYTKELNEYKQSYDELSQKVKEYIALRQQVAKSGRVDEDVPKVRELKNEIDQMSERLRQNPLYDQSFEAKALKGLNDIDAKVQSIRFDKIVKNYQQIGDLSATRQKLINDGWSEDSEFIQFLDGEIEKLNEVNAALIQLDYTQEQHAAIQDAEKASTIAVTREIEKKQIADQKAADAGKKANQELEKTRTNLLGQVASLRQNGKIMKESGDQINAFYEEIKDTGTSKERLEQIRIELGKIKAEATAAGKSGKTLGQIIKQRAGSLVAYLSTFASFYRVVGTIRQAISTIRELDTELIDLRKTTKMSNGELEQFYKESNTIAIQTGVTTKEIIAQAAAWSRLGYNTKETSAQMAELSSVFASISPGVDVENATDYLVSSMKAFGKTTDEVQRDIMDNINAIGKQILPKHMVTYGAKLIA